MTDQKKITEVEEVSGFEPNAINDITKEPEEEAGIELEPMSSLEDALKRIHKEADFAAKNLDGKSKEFGSTLNVQMSKFEDLIQEYAILIASHENQIKTNQEGLSVLTLIPEKLQNRIEDVAPQFAIEVEKIHSLRMETITSQIAELQQGLKDSVIQNQNAIEETTKESIRLMQEAQSNALENQKKLMVDFAQSVKEEVEAVTSNHGRKFLRNLVITLILATIAGGLTSWSVGTYFPRLIHIGRAGDITVKDSAVKILEAASPKISESSHKKVVK